jgi:7-keto-8-aminopelargonate synthetase-like enzyme
MNAASPRRPGPVELHSDAADHLEGAKTDILSRWARHLDYWDARKRFGLDFSLRTVLGRGGAEAQVWNGAHETLNGINFAAEDQLGLAAHPSVHAAAVEAAAMWGVHATGSLSRQGGSLPIVALQERIADAFCCSEATLFPSGWAAGYGAIRTLIGRQDHVIIDEDSPAGIREGAFAATDNVHVLPSCMPYGVAELLGTLRAGDTRCGILVAAQTITSANSASVDLASLHDRCRRHGANLLVDVSQDFGAMGERGMGLLGTYGMVGEVDIVIGSLAKTFASNGGFVAAAAPGIRAALAVFASTLHSSQAISPMQAAAAVAAFDIMLSAEGVRRRRQLFANATSLRDGLTARAFTVCGHASGVVPLPFADNAEARLMTREALRLGALVNLDEPPCVSGKPRWRLHVTADHASEQIEKMVAIAAAAREHVVQIMNE